MTLKSVFALVSTLLLSLSVQSDKMSPYDQAFHEMKLIFGRALVSKNLILEAVLVDESVTRFAAVRKNGKVVTLNVNQDKVKTLPISKEVWQTVLCHEFGHVFGGAPYVWTNPDDGGEIPNEGQADYFASSKCLRRLYTNESENRIYVQGLSLERVNKIKARGCETDQCIRVVNAAYETLTAFAEGEIFFLDKISDEKVESTRSGYEANSAQCRLDTFIAGAICPIDPEVAFGDSSQREGACVSDSPNALVRAGARPACWFNPVKLDSFY